MVCSVDRLYHYMLSGARDLGSILEHGLLPLSARPESDRWKQMESGRPGFFEWIYEAFAKPIVQLPYRHSGVFLTPIDFRDMAGVKIADLPRIVIPLDAVDPLTASVTYMLNGQRMIRPLTVEDLEDTARIWSEDMVRAWFAKDRTMMFFHVPQVAAYQEGGIPVRPEWVER